MNYDDLPDKILEDIFNRELEKVLDEEYENDLDYVDEIEEIWR